MSIPSASKLGRMLFAATLAGTLSASALPVLAASTYTETITVQHRELNPKTARIAADTGRTLVDDMHQALKDLNVGDTALARAQVKRSLNLADVIETLLPYTSVAEKVTDQQGKVESQTVEEFHDALLPIYADIDEMQVYAPKAAAKARQHLEESDKHMKAGNPQAAKESLRLVAEDITTHTVYLPVGTVRSHLKAAMDTLEKKEPDTAAAKKAVESALGSVTVFVDEMDVAAKARHSS